MTDNPCWLIDLKADVTTPNFLEKVREQAKLLRKKAVVIYSLLQGLQTYLDPAWDAMSYDFQREKVPEVDESQVANNEVVTTAFANRRETYGPLITDFCVAVWVLMFPEMPILYLYQVYALAQDMKKRRNKNEYYW